VRIEASCVSVGFVVLEEEVVERDAINVRMGEDIGPPGVHAR
jgi:hypothetical protein